MKTPDLQLDSQPAIVPVGLHYDIPPALYHADPAPRPSLSSSIARIIVEDTPAHAHRAHPRLGGKRSSGGTDAMDFGGIVHALLAGQPEERAEYVVSPFDDYRTNEAKAWKAHHAAAGKTPIKQPVLDAATICAGAMREALNLRPDTMHPLHDGKPEVTAIWEEGGIYCRARYDRLVLDPNGFADVWDFKVTTSVTASKIQRAITDHGYAVQAAFYLRGLRPLLPEYAGRFSFLFAFIESEPPHTVRVVPMTEGWLALGDAIANRAIRLWRECMESNTWPSYTGANLAVEPPAWYAMQIEERQEATQ